MSHRHFRFYIPLTLVVLVLLWTTPANAETRLMLVLDASESMSAPGTPGSQGTKFRELRGAITLLLQELPADVAVGLRIFGGSESADCFYTYRIYEPSQGNRTYIQDELENTYPGGQRGLYQGIQEGLDDLILDRTGGDSILLVITDGGDACDRDFENLAREYEYRGSLPSIVIFGLDLPTSTREELGEFAAQLDGRLIDSGSIVALKMLLSAFAAEFDNNLRIHLQDSSGQAVFGDLIVRDAETGNIVLEMIDVTDYSLDVPAGTYEVEGRYLGQEILSHEFTINADESRSITLTFDIDMESLTVYIRDLYGNSVRGRLTFYDISDDPILTTEFATTHYVSLPPGSYYVDVRLGDHLETIYGIGVGPGFDNSIDIELQVELGVLEIDVNNYELIPVNAEISIYDMDGTMVEHAAYASYLYARLPPGTYRVEVESGDQFREETAHLFEGDQITLGFDLDLPLGDIFVRLVTESGYDAWGVIRIYDDRGNLLERFYQEDWESPDWFIDNIPIGLYRIQAEADGVIRIISGVEVRANEETEVEIVFPDEVW